MVGLDAYRSNDTVWVIDRQVGVGGARCARVSKYIGKQKRGGGTDGATDIGRDEFALGIDAYHGVVLERARHEISLGDWWTRAAEIDNTRRVTITITTIPFFGAVVMMPMSITPML
jgi:hypothetical protein